MENQKTILITGSSRGIGAACARLAKKKGYQVVLHGRTESEQLVAISKELDGAKYITCDVSDENAVFEAVNNVVKDVGTIDVLVNNAGINQSGKFEEISHEDWQKTFDVNIMGVVNFTKAVLPGMREKKYGRIVNISSIRGLACSTSKAAYAASKAAVIVMTASLAKEYASFGINVNCVAPGFTNTDMFAASYKAHARIRDQVETIPLKRAGEPREIADTIMFLAGDESSYITGQTIVVDGGFGVK